MRIVARNEKGKILEVVPCEMKEVPEEILLEIAARVGAFSVTLESGATDVVGPSRTKLSA